MSAEAIKSSRSEIWKTFPYQKQEDYETVTINMVDKVAIWFFTHQAELRYKKVPCVVDLALGIIDTEVQEDWNCAIGPALLQKIQDLFQK